MNAVQRISRLNREQQKLLELRMKQRGVDIRQIPITGEYRKNRRHFPLALEQEPMWVIEKLDPDNPSYDAPGTVNLEGNLDLEILEKSINEVVKRHESLRLVFQTHRDKPVQVVLPSLTLRLEYMDITDLPADEQENRLKQLREDNRLYTFDLASGPLVKTLLIGLSQNRYIFITIMHHIIGDLLSLKIFLKEVAWFYTLFSRGQPPAYALPVLSCQYPDYACWQQHWYRDSLLGGETRQKQETFWLEMFKDEVPVLNLPTDYPRPALKSYEGGHGFFSIKGEKLKVLKDIFLAENTSLYVVLLSIYYVFLAKISGQEDIVVGTPINRRQNKTLTDMIGLFVKTVPVRNYPQGGKTFKQFLSEVNARIFKVFQNQDYPYEELVGKIATERDASRNPLFDVLFNFIYIDINEIEMPGLTVRPYRFKPKRVGFDLDLVCEGTYEELFFKFSYCTKLFKEETINRFISYFQTVLATVLDHLEVRISRIGIISAAEKKQVLFDFNHTAALYPGDKTIMDLVEEQVLKTPDHTAALFEHRVLSYGALLETANRLARVLRSKGTGPDGIVGLMAERSLEMLTGIMGILNAGGAYLPIDPQYPEERKKYLINDSGMQWLLVQGQGESQAGDCQILHLDEPALYAGAPGPPPGKVNIPANLVYVIYTSGSTGKPKGVMINHYSLVNRLHWMQKKYRLTGRDTILQKTPFTFDVSLWELFWWAITGARVCLLVPGGEKDPKVISDAAAKDRVTVMHFVPSMLKVFLEFIKENRSQKNLSGVRWIICSGEALTPALVKEFHEVMAPAPPPGLANLYGPTEATVDVSWFDCSALEAPGVIPLGKPIDNIRLYVLDHYFYPQPPGIPGELVIAGDGLARGYINRPELTADKFCLRRPGGRFLKKLPPWTPRKNFLLDQSPITNHQSPIYKTGDLAKWRPDGNLEFLGRIDHQVKIRGFRVELGEIENQLLTYPGIKDAVVVVKTDKTGDRYLCAYAAANKELGTAELREYLSGKLPAYMIPAYFVTLDRIPLTTNGKLDRKALPEPGWKIDVQYVRPRNNLEKKLVEIYESVLDKKNIGINENFFMIGGDSIKFIQIISKLNRANYKVEMRDLFNYPTIAQLAQVVVPSRHTPDQSIISGRIPLTPIQENFFATHKISPHHFNLSFLFHLAEPLEEELIKAMFKKIQEHHDALRMTFTKDENGKIIQTGHGPDYPFSIQVYDLRERENAGIIFKQEINKLQAGIELENGPLMKLGLFHLDNGTRLLVSIHHLVCDGVSWRILLEDMEILYQQYKKGQTFDLPLKTDSYKLWAEQLNEYVKSPSFLRQKAYWLEVESTPVPPITKDFAEESNDVKDAERVSFGLDEQKTDLLLTKANEAFATDINDILLAALGLSIKEVFGPDKVAIVRESHGREEILESINISRTVGWFTSEYPIILDLSHTDDPSRQIREIKESLHRVPAGGTGYGILEYLAADEHRQEIKIKLKPQVIFNYLGQFDRDVEQLSFAKVEEFSGDNISREERRAFDLDVVGIIVKKRLVINITYNKKQYKPETINTLLARYKEKLSQLILYCAAKKERVYSPSDFTYKDLTLEETDALNVLLDTTFGKDNTGKTGHIRDIYTLSPMQEGMLFHSLYDTSSSAHFIQINYRIRGKFEVPAIKKSLDFLLERHNTLRTAFVYEGVKVPVQVVLNNRKADFYYEDLQAIKSKGEQELFIKQFKEKDKNRLFDFLRDVLMRAAVIRLDETEYDFTWSFHHILMDGWCIGVIIKEFFEIYTNYLENREPQLSPVKPYRAYIQWLEKQDRNVSGDYWANYLRDFEEAANIGIMKSGKTVSERYKLEQLDFSFDAKETREMQELASKNYVTLNTFIQVIWGTILKRYNNKDEVVFGVVVSGRPAEIDGVESMIGLFINTIPVRIRFEKEITFNRLMQRVQEDALNSDPHHIYPLADIQSQSALKQNLLDHILVFENYPIAENVSGLITANEKNRKGEKYEVIHVDVFEQTNYDFNVLITPGQQLRISLSYNGNVYDSDFAARIAACFRYLSRQVLSNEDVKIRELEILSDKERELVLKDFNDTVVQYREEKLIHHLFEEQVEKGPDHIALVGNWRLATGNRAALTYRELNEQSHRLAFWLRQKRVTPDTLVAILAERSLEIIIAVLGILKAGGTYLPIDPEYPADRIDYLLKDSSAGILLVSPETQGKVKIEAEMKVIDIIDISTLLSSAALPSTSEPAPSAASLAYILYTSGSTGKPKGVAIRHGSVVNYTGGVTAIIDFQVNDRVLSLTTISFDIFFLETVVPLICGSRVVIGTPEQQLNPWEAASAIEREGVSIFQLTPSRLQLFISHAKAAATLKLLRYLLVSGEAFTQKLADQAGPLIRGRMFNLYGPTETTVQSTVKEVFAGTPVNIGKPMANTFIYILDSHLNPVPIGVPADIYIGGDGLGRGYLNNPELTQERFINYKLQNTNKETPFGQMLNACGDFLATENTECTEIDHITNHHSTTPTLTTHQPPLTTHHSTLYQTGDLGRWLPEGDIECLGRVDLQVKIRGFRIELEEIEKRLTSHETVKEAVVIAKDDEKGNTVLCAFYVPRQGEPADPGVEVSQLREFLSAGLPYYMVPAYFITLDRIPLTPNKKIDRKALEARQIHRTLKGTQQLAPQTELEKQIALCWKKVLQLEEIDIHDHFFDLGGNSISIIQLSNELKEVLGRNIPVVSLFQHRTISSFARYIKTQENKAGNEKSDLDQKNKILNKKKELLNRSIKKTMRGKYDRKKTR